MADLEKLLAEATPGPWAKDDLTSTTHHVVGAAHIINCNDKSVSRIAHVSGWVEDEAEANEASANARLIALAPSLAAALLVADKALRVHSKRLRHCSTNIVDEYPVWSGDLLKMAEDADAALSEIEKLTGGGE